VNTWNIVTGASAFLQVAPQCTCTLAVPHCQSDSEFNSDRELGQSGLRSLRRPRDGPAAASGRRAGPVARCAAA